MSIADETICVFCRFANIEVDDLGLCAKCRELMTAASLSQADIERLIRYRRQLSPIASGREETQPDRSSKGDGQQ